MKTSRAEYIKPFYDDRGERQKEALRYAHDIRKFEIDLYWRRAAYFWTFIGAAFAAYILLQKDSGSSNSDSTLVVVCLGLLFSVSWYLVNRGSSSWQRNWERHVDLLEDEVTGPLYKSMINRRSHRLFDLVGPYAFSPSKINNIIALYVCAVWLALMIRTVIVLEWLALWSALFVAVMMVMTLVAIFALIRFGRASETSGPELVDLRVRRYD